MLRRMLPWAWSHKRLTCGGAVLSMFLIANLAAFMQARSMTRFAPAGVRTAAPEQLGYASKLRVLLTGVTVPRPVNRQTPANLDLTFATFHTPSTDGIDLELWHIPATPLSALKPRTM